MDFRNFVLSVFRVPFISVLIARMFQMVETLQASMFICVHLWRKSHKNSWCVADAPYKLQTLDYSRRTPIIIMSVGAST